jgi:anti-sigma factor RsiW
VTDCSELQHDGLLQCYLDGEVETSVAFRVVVHLDRCRACAREAEALEMLKRALRRQRVADPEVVTRLCTFAALLTRGGR